MPTVINSSLLNCRKDIVPWLKACGYKRLCEVGVREGDHLKTWLLADPLELVAVDMWANMGVLSMNDKMQSQERFDAMLNDLRAWGNKVVPRNLLKILRGLSDVMAEGVDDASLDFVYLDADHTYSAIKSDIAAWWPKVRVGGTLAGHDYVKRTLPNGVSFGVIQAVTEFAARVGLTEPVWNTGGRMDQGKDHYASWFVTKTEEMGAVAAIDRNIEHRQSEGAVFPDKLPS